jgi:energy-coupling factor transporter transmembrane protein EcfT
MLFESDFHSIFIPAMIAIVIFIVGYYFWQRKRKNELEKAISLFKVSTVAVGLLSILLWFMLPSTASLSSFGFPETVKEIQSNEQLLNYLQEYNQAIVRITRVVYWFIFIFVWWFLVSVYSVTKAVSNQ